MPHATTSSAPRHEAGARLPTATFHGRARQAAAFAGLTLLAALAAGCREEAPPPVAPPAGAASASSTTASSTAASSTDTRAPAAPAADPTAAEVPLPVRPLPTGKYTTAEDGAQSVVLGDLRIETSADLPQREASTTTNVAGDNQLVFMLRGWQINVSGGNLFVAGHDFGPAPAGSVIRLSKDGVRVGTELRGPLP